MINDDLLNKLGCIKCGDHLSVNENSKSLSCNGCSSEYPFKDEIPSMAQQSSEEQDWNTWDDEEYLKMGESYKRRANGELPEKEASKSYARLMKKENLYASGDHLLDVGAASGHFYRSFRSILDNDVRYTGIDITHGFLKWGKDAYREIENVDFVHCDALKQPFQDNSFDTVIVNLFHFFPNIDDALKEVFRVAKKRVIWRTPVGEANYAIKAIYENDFNKIGTISHERTDYPFELCMIYTKDYLKGLIEHLGGKIDFIKQDLDFKNFDNNNLDGFNLPSSKAVDGVQTVGSVIYDWHYVCISV